jgi:hypothetical protein
VALCPTHRRQRPHQQEWNRDQDPQRFGETERSKPSSASEVIVSRVLATWWKLGRDYRLEAADPLEPGEILGEESLTSPGPRWSGW